MTINSRTKYYDFADKIKWYFIVSGNVHMGGEKMLNMSWLEKDAVAMSLCCLDPDRYMVKSVKKEDITKNQSEKTKIIFMEEYSENTVMMNMDKLYVCTGDKQDCLLDIKQIKIKVSKIPSIVLKDQYRASIKIISNAGFIHKYYFSSEQNPHIYVAYENDDTDKNKEYYLFIEDCEAVQV